MVDTGVIVELAGEEGVVYSEEGVIVAVMQDGTLMLPRGHPSV